MKQLSPSSGQFSRREFLRIASLLAAGGAISACSPLLSELAHEPISGDLPPYNLSGHDNTIFTKLSRMTFGPRLDERVYAADIGLETRVEEQLSPDTIDDTLCSLRLRSFDTLEMRATELVDWSDKLFDDQDRTTVPSQLQQATLLRQIYSKRQLYELMVVFWSDHFNISIDKGDCWFLKTVDDRKVIRKHALGNFRDLLWASAHSP